MNKGKHTAPEVGTQERKGHLLEINTKNHVFMLDGMDISDCVYHCDFSLDGNHFPTATLKMVADIDLKDVAEFFVSGKV